MKKIKKPSRLQAFLYAHIEASPLTQKEIAEAVGYENPNMITILKQGDAKLALDRVVPMAEVLGVDPRHLFALALEAYYGDANARVMMKMFGKDDLLNQPVEPVKTHEPAT
ncbi:MAG: transcriptional regulator [Stutzerimonas stutzeri]|nr:MAG: transcriptional regulator [Stutzerimonas stutzeri]